MNDSPDLLDFDTLNDLRTMLDDGLDELLAEYMDDSSKSVAAMEDAAARTDLETLATLAHSLKGSSGNLGVHGMYRLCERIEMAARSGESATVVSLVSELPQVYDKSRQALAAVARQ